MYGEARTYTTHPGGTTPADDVTSELAGIVDAEDLTILARSGAFAHHPDPFARVERLMRARERLGLGVGVPERRLELLSSLIEDVMRRVRSVRATTPGETRRQRELLSRYG